jgi:plastocyanin
MIRRAAARAGSGMRAGIAATAVIVALAGCAGDEEQPPAATTATPTATPTATEPAEASAGPAKVAIVDFEYEPGELTVEPGTKVTWTNQDASNHTVSFENGPGDLGNVDEDGRLSARFEKPGSYPYVCQYHPNMKGRITVR